jgi:hypothetical protein
VARVAVLTLKMRPARLRDGSFVWIDLAMTRAVHALASLKNPKRLLLNRNKLALRRPKAWPLIAATTGAGIASIEPPSA